MASDTRRRRAGGRAANFGRRNQDLFKQMPWRVPKNTDRPTEPLDPDGVERIHDAAMRVLEEVGIEFLNDEACGLFREAGCKVDGTNVKMGRDWVMEMVGKAPGAFTLTPWNEARKITIGDGHIVFGNVSSPPNYMDLEIGRKVPGTREQNAKLLKLVQHFNCIHFAGGYPVEPVDLHPSVRHLDVLYDKLTLTDKVVHAYSLGRERVEDVMEMVKIAGGLTEDEFRATPRMYTNINSTSPLKHDQPMIDGCLRCVRRGQAVVVSPFTLAGAMAPVTMAGAVVLSIAEALSAIALFQYVAPGCACVIGTFTSNVDMKSGAPAFGTPTQFQASLAAGQMARMLGLPWRSAAGSASNVNDVQAANENQMGLWGCLLSGATVIIHSAGWLEGGLTVSLEKIVTDVEVLNMVAELCAGRKAGTDEIGFVNALSQVAPQGHFFATPQTMERYNTEFYEPIVHDYANFGTWTERGSRDANARATDVWESILARPDQTMTPPDRLDALRAFIDKRTAEGGAPPES